MKGIDMIQIENWQGINGKLVHDDQKAIVVDDDQDLSDYKVLQIRLESDGLPIDKARQAMIKKTVKRQLKIEPLKFSGWFNRHQNNKNAKKAEKLTSNKATHQYKQIKNELTFFGEGFLEGFLGFYGLEVDNALGRYEHNLHVLETQKLGRPEKEYYLANSQNGSLQLVSGPLPSQQLAEEQLTKFYQREPGQTQAEKFNCGHKKMKERRNNMPKFSKIKTLAVSGVTAGYLALMNFQVVYAASGSEVESKLKSATKTIQGVLTGLVVLVGICVALFIIIKRMPDADDPREKSEVYHAVGRVAGLVALAAAVIWLLPWVYSLFT